MTLATDAHPRKPYNSVPMPRPAQKADGDVLWRLEARWGETQEQAHARARRMPWWPLVRVKRGWWSRGSKPQGWWSWVGAPAPKDGEIVRKRRGR